MEMNRRTALQLMGAAGATLAVPSLALANRSEPELRRPSSSNWRVESRMPDGKSPDGQFLSEFIGTKRETMGYWCDQVTAIKEGRIEPHMLFRFAPQYVPKYDFQFGGVQFGQELGNDTYRFGFEGEGKIVFADVVRTVTAGGRFPEFDCTTYRYFDRKGPFREPFYNVEAYHFGTYHWHRFCQPEQRHRWLWYRQEFRPLVRFGDAVETRPADGVQRRLEMYGCFETC